MTFSEKRKKIEELVLGTMSRMDKILINTEKYRKFFKSMNDENFKKWIEKFLKNEDENFYMEFLPYKNEPTLQDLVDAGKYINIPLDEYIYLRHDGNKSDPIRSAKPVPVGYISIKRLQQMLQKKNSYSLDISVRNQKTGQLTSNSKIARLTEAENYALAAYGATEVGRELMGPRADDSVGKSEMYKQIATQGYFSLNDLTNDVANKQTLNTVNTFFLGAGIRTDLITPDLELRRTIEARKRRVATSEKIDEKTKK